jgi:hypothetical protein
MRPRRELASLDCQVNFFDLQRQGNIIRTHMWQGEVKRVVKWVNYETSLNFCSKICNKNTKCVATDLLTEIV